MRTIASTVTAFASCMFVATTVSAQSSEKATSTALPPSSPILASNDEASKIQPIDSTLQSTSTEQSEPAVSVPVTIRVQPLQWEIAPLWYGWKTLLAFLPTNVLMLASACNEVDDVRQTLLSRSLGMISPPDSTPPNKPPLEKAAASTTNVGPRATGVTIGAHSRKEASKNLYGSVGIMLVHVIDTAAISWKRDPPTTTTSSAERFLPSSIVVAPRIDMTTKGFSVTSRF